jgi:hypothetical protein
MRKIIVNSLFGIIIMSLVGQLAACGTLLFPERRGQKSGEIDVKIAVLDGLGLILFVIPGIVAYIIDFTTGAIYLPSGKRNVVMLDGCDVTTIRVNPELLRNPDAIKEIVVGRMGLPSTIDWSRLEASKIDQDQVRVRLAEAKAVGYATVMTSTPAVYAAAPVARLLYRE